MRRKEQKMKWLCVFPNKEKDRDKLFGLLWIALDQCICWIFSHFAIQVLQYSCLNSRVIPSNASAESFPSLKSN